MTRKPWILSVALAFVVVISMTVGGLVARQVGTGPDTAAQLTPTSASATRSIASNVATNTPGLADLVDQAIKSVVLIQGGTAAGSGIVIDGSGHVVTNYHVVEGQDTLKVVLQDGTAARATVVGTDPSTDLAVLKTDFARSKLTPATFGDSTHARPGDAVFAIGAPFDQPFTVTSGIISATERTTQSSFTGRSIRDVLQTDAAVNPGNSGGPLFNLDGEVIGINSSIENPEGRFFVGLGFAIPSNTVLNLLPELIAGRTVPHAQLGVSVLALDEVVASDIGVSVGRGLYVTSVQPASAAARAGIVAAVAPQLRAGQVPDGPPPGGDVILSVDGHETRTFVDLARAIDNASIGSTISITVLRDGQRVDLSATLQPWDARGN